MSFLAGLLAAASIYAVTAVPVALIAGTDDKGTVLALMFYGVLCGAIGVAVAHKRLSP